MDTEAIVIGAGISGLAAAKSMKDVGFEVLVLEMHNEVGGLWSYKEKKYGVMKFTHINVSKQNYCYSDFPVPDDAPDYLHHSELADYIGEYTRHFKLDELIRFNRKVTSVIKRESDDRWVLEVEILEEDEKGVTKATGQTETYTCKYLGVASGHHSRPISASFPGLDTFQGEVYHSVNYKDAAYNKVEGKKVVVVGIGNSAVDVVVNVTAAGRCRPVYVSSRSGAWVLPNYIFGHPTDHYACRFFLSLPWKLGSFVMETLLNILQGHPSRWGLKPKMRVLQTQPTVSPTLIHHIQRGDVRVVPNIQKVSEKTVTFDDGSTVDADVIILCTGYSIDLPFLSKDIKQSFLDQEINDLRLYKNVFAPELGHSLALIGFLQPASGGLLTMSETQARWWAELCRNHIILPMKRDMNASIDRDLVYVKSRWFSSKRHTIQKDPILYNDELTSKFGAKPMIKDNPTLAWRLLLGSCGAAQWRLQGPGRWSGASDTVRKVPVTGFLLYGAVFLLVLALYLFWTGIAFVCDTVFG